MSVTVAATTAATAAAAAATAKTLTAPVATSIASERQSAAFGPRLKIGTSFLFLAQLICKNFRPRQPGCTS